MRVDCADQCPLITATRRQVSETASQVFNPSRSLLRAGVCVRVFACTFVCVRVSNVCVCVSCESSSSWASSRYCRLIDSRARSVSLARRAVSIPVRKKLHHPAQYSEPLPSVTAVPRYCGFFLLLFTARGSLLSPLLQASLQQTVPAVPPLSIVVHSLQLQRPLSLFSLLQACMQLSCLQPAKPFLFFSLL